MVNQGVRANHGGARAAALDGVFYALSDPTRRAMLERLGRGAVTVSELKRPFSMSLPAVLQHLSVLEASGLVRSHKQGRVRTCRLERAPLTAAERWLSERRAQVGAELDRLGEYLLEQEARDRENPAKDPKKP